MNKKENRGITLVALVITIIVLIILAGVSINAVMNGGLITNAKDARDEFDKAKQEEETTLIDYELTSHFVLNNLKYKCNYGFITGITTEKSQEGPFVAELASNLVQALPSGYYLYNTDKSGKELQITGEPITATDTETLLGSGMAIKKDEKIVAVTIMFGDIDGNGINDIDDSNNMAIIMNNIDKIKDTNYTYAIIASDLDHNGIMNNYDYKEEVAYIGHNFNTELFEQNVSAPNPKLLEIQNKDMAIQAFIQNNLSEDFNITKNGRKYIITGINIGVTTQAELKELIPEILEIDRSDGYTDPIQKGDEVYIIPNYYGFNDEASAFYAIVD